MRWFSFLLTVSLLFVVVPLHSVAAEVRIGIDNNPPLTFIDDQGRAQGLFPDLFSQVAKEKNWSVKFVPCEWQQCLQSLSSGEIDILPAIAYTEQRAKQYRYSSETVVSSWGQVYSRSDNSFPAILDLADKKVAVLKDDVYLNGEHGLRKFAENFDIEIDFIEVDSYRDAFLQLESGAVDAAMVGRIYGLKHHHQFDLLPTPLMVKPIHVRPAFSPVTAEKYAVEYEQLFAQWKQTPGSTYFKLLDKWLVEKNSAAIPAELKLVMYALAAILILLLATTLWTRKQVKAKTLQLAEKNQLLKQELKEREKVEQELLESKLQYQTFFEESFSTMLLVDPDTASIIDANPAACKFYKYDRDELQNMKMWQINQLSETETYERLAVAKTLDHHRFEFVHTLADGEQVPVEVFRSPIQVKGKTLFYAIINDIRKRKKAEKALAERSQFLQSVIDGVSDPLMVIDLDYRILQMNRSARNSRPQCDDEEFSTCYCHSHKLNEPCSGKDHPCPLLEVKETGNPTTMIHQHDSDKGKRIVEITASPLFDAQGALYAIIEVARDITERLQIEGLLSENEKRLHHLAHHDSLTDLPNRLLFEDRLDHALLKARRSHRQVALLFLDLDYLKAVNDNLGHDSGDKLLIDIAKRLRKCVREGDTIARMGGDEFLVLLEEVESIGFVEAMAERVCESLNHTLNKGAFTQEISASIGISIYPEDASTGAEMLRNADLAMYRVKNNGKGSYQFYSPPQGRLLF